MYIDDVIYDGEETVFRKLVLYSSICAVLVLNLEAELTGDPQIFYPRVRSPANIANFNREYRAAFDILIPFFEQTDGSNTESSQSSSGSE